MAILYFAKLNVNSSIFEVYDGKISIDDILEKLYNKFDDITEYKIEEKNSVYKEDGSYQEVLVKREIYNFSNLEKVSNGNECYIIGQLIRRFPIFSEEFDEKTRESQKKVYDKNSSSIRFYFDIKNEIICFCERKYFGTKQFIESFQNLVNLYLKKVGFEIFLIQNLYTLEEQLLRVHKILKIKATIIPPNANEEAIQRLHDECDKDVIEMKEAYITKRTNIFETSAKAKRGINPESDIIRRSVYGISVLDKVEKGYGNIVVDGFNKDGSEFHYDSGKDSPFTKIITDVERDSLPLFIELCKVGINEIRAKQTLKKYE